MRTGLEIPEPRDGPPAGYAPAEPGHARITLPAIPQSLIDACDVAAIARILSPIAVMTLAEIASDPDAPASARAAAANSLLERGHGKPVATTIMANPDGSGLFSGVEIVLVRPQARPLIEHASRVDVDADNDDDSPEA